MNVQEVQSAVRLPNDLKLERDVLGSCLLRPDKILGIGLSEEDFALDANRLVWRAMNQLVEAAEPVDLVRVRSKLLDWDSLGAAGGEKHLETLRMVMPAKSLPIDRLLRMKRLRAMRASAEAVAAAAAGDDADLANAALEATTELANEGAVVRGPKSARQLADEWYASLNRDPLEGTVTPGLAALKRSVGRLECGSMTLIGADVNVGKSSIALEMMLAAILDGESVGYLSMEDPEKIVVERVMSCLGGMSAKKVRKFRPGGPDESKINKAMEAMHAINDKLLVSNCIGMNERDTLSEMTAMAKAGCRLIVLDYIGVVGCSVKQQDRRNEIRWIATRFKARACYTKTALVVASQFQRPKDGDSGKKPSKHSFRESGDLEAMAEYAIVMWRKVEDDFAPVYCELAKSKTGGVGYGWTMQRESECLDADGYVIAGKTPSGRLVEVMHTEERILDDDGFECRVRPVSEDISGHQRWMSNKSAR